MQRWLAVILAFVLAGCTTMTPADAQGTASEPPLIAGRIAVADGDAQIWRAEEDNATGQWDGAVVNDVASAGTGLYTGADGRNEVRVGPHTFRMAASSRGGFTQLDYSTALFNLEYGTLNVRLARPEHGETTSVTVAELRIDLVAPGRYRIDATDRGPIRLTVFEGHGTVRSAANATGVSPGQAVVVNPGGGGFGYEQPIVSAFDQWALERDAQFQQVRSVQFVSPYMTGYEELDTYGDWSSDASFGAVWFPRAVPVGWAPYRFGQWRWIRPWGWTWVDFAPWGYAPFHYGRWVMVGPRWAWVPGGYVRQPVWAPALVGFVGSGVSVVVSVGSPTVGWYPLAPWHRYEPHYRHSPRYTTIINQTIINQPPRGVPRDLTQGPGTTMVPGPRFREPIHRVALPVPPKPQDLKPVAPPPLNVAPAPRSPTPRFSDNDGRPGTPKSQMARPPQAPGQSPGQPAPGSPPTRVTPPMAADPMPGRGVTPPPPLPGNDPAPLRQPPGLNKVQPAPQAPAPAAPQPPRATPRPNLPSDQIPPGQPQPINPAEPPRFPPGAPPTIRQPQAMVPAARPVQPSPPVQAPAVRAVPQPPAQAAPPRPAPPTLSPAAPSRPTPPAAVPAPAPSAPVAAPQPKPQPVPSQKEQVLRNPPEQERGRPMEREAPPLRQKQADR